MSDQPPLPGLRTPKPPAHEDGEPGTQTLSSA